jgi:hypothetical protein
MRTTIAALLAAATLGPAAPAAAQGITLGLRAGWAKPLGETFQQQGSDRSPPFDQQFTRAIPVLLEAGYRLPVGLTFGGYFQYGPATVADTAVDGMCSEPGATCDGGRLKRFGAQVTWHFQGLKPFTPWVGYGAGYEWSSFDESDPSGSGTITFKGWEFANLQLGGDYAVAPRWFLGPYISMSYGRFDAIGLESGGMSASIDIPEKRVHSWLQLGLRGRFDL